MAANQRTRRASLPPEQLARLREEIRQLLIQVAKEGATIAYSDFAARIRAVPMGPRDGLMHGLFCDISRDEERAGRGLLCVVVVKKGPNGMPGKGYFAFAKGLGRDDSKKRQSFESELARVHAEWKAAGR